MEELRAAVTLATGRECGALTRATMGRSASVTYFADADGLAIVVKTSSTPGVLAATVHNTEVLRDLGVPVAPVVAMIEWEDATGFEAVVMERLRGRDLAHELPDMTRPQMTVLAEQIVSFQRLVATLPRNTGCGFVPIGAPATRPWIDVVRHPSPRPIADPVPPDVNPLLPRLERAIDAADSYLARVEPVCFLDDLTTKNVLVDAGVLTGVVDFDVVCYGDPGFHLGLTAAAVTANAPDAARFYVDELLRFAAADAPARAAVDLYEAVFLVHFLAYESPTDQGSWRERAAAAAAARLETSTAFFGVSTRPK
jgi:aminoglycoside phosphotransferase (APT) family kinase protein